MHDAEFADVAVMGAGAVGCYYGAMLARTGARVRLIGRPALVDAVTHNGLRLETEGGAERIAVTATTDPAGVAGAGLVLFCVKSTGTDEAARAIAPHLDPSTIVLSLQNGVDNAARIRTRCIEPGGAGGGLCGSGNFCAGRAPPQWRRRPGHRRRRISPGGPADHGGPRRSPQRRRDSDARLRQYRRRAVGEARDELRL